VISFLIKSPAIIKEVFIFISVFIGMCNTLVLTVIKLKKGSVTFDTFSIV
jgi:hypothetical protein